MASKTIDNLVEVFNMSKDNLLIVGQGSLSNKATIQQVFSLTSRFSGGEMSSDGVTIPYLSYLEQNLTDGQKFQIKSNLGISAEGVTIASGVQTVNGEYGTVMLYGSNIPISDSDTTKIKKYIDDNIEKAISDHNSLESAHTINESSLVRTGDIDGIITNKSIVTSNNIDSIISDKGIVTTGNTSTTLSSYATKQYVTDQGYIKSADMSGYIKDSTTLSGSNNNSLVSYSYSQNLDDNQRSTARSNIGAMSSSLTVCGQSAVNNNISLTYSNVNAMPNTLTVCGQSAVNNNISLSASNITNAVSTSRKVFGKALSSDVTTLDASYVTSALSGTTLTGALTTQNITIGGTYKLLLNTSMYGTGDPPSGASNGQIYFKIIS